MTKVIELSKAIKDKIAKFAKLTFNTSTHHDATFDTSTYVDNAKDFHVEDVKFYKNVKRIDALTLTRADIDARLQNVALYDRLAFERAFEFEATYVVACNSKAVALNLTHHERKYSTLYRRVALYARRCDLYVMCAMSKKQRADVFKSSHFARAFDLQVATLKLADVKNAKLADCFAKTFKVAFDTLQTMFVAKLSNAKTQTAKLVNAKIAKTNKVAVAK
jgi:hypothetical protein